MKLLLMFFILHVIQEAAVVKSRNKHNTKRNSRISHGELTTIDKYPFFASLIVTKWPRKEHYCGSSIISHYWVITAAHCIKGAHNISEWFLRMGTSQWDAEKEVQEFTEDHNVDSIFVHEKYFTKAGAYFDIALVKVTSEIRYEYNKFIQTVLIAGPNYLYTNGTFCTTVDFGGNYSTSKYNTTSLRRFNMAIVDGEECDDTLIGEHAVDKICAKDLKEDGYVYNGDTGRPLVQLRGSYYILIGIASITNDFLRPYDIPQVFTRIGSKEVTKWIKRHKTGAYIYDGE